MSSYVCAGPWIDVGNVRLRNNLEMLNDSGALTISLTTWPIMWADVHKAINNVDETKLGAAQRSAIRELKFEMQYQTSSDIRKSVELVASNNRALLRDFSSFQREKGEIHKEIDWQGDNAAYRLNANLMSDSGDDAVEANFYGSYIATVLGGQDGNWVLGAGAIDRWWGAGSQSSLILSNNALPVPGFFLRTKHGQRFESPWLSWLGEWHFVSFLGQMESNRTIPEAKLTGMRFTFMPVNGLEIGLSRAMQWGGVGRSDELKTFFKSLTSQGENEEGDSGNQLAGVDVRYGFNVSDLYSGAIYLQTIGEDEAGYMPARRTHQFGGVLTQSLNHGDFFRYELEYVNTTADAFESVFYNMTYEHFTYQNGYRYRGRSLGASVDNDSEVVSLGGYYQKGDGAWWGARVGYLSLNEDGVASGNVISLGAQPLFMLKLEHQCFLFDGKLRVGVSMLSKRLDTPQDHSRIQAVLAWNYRF